MTLLEHLFKLLYCYYYSNNATRHPCRGSIIGTGCKCLRKQRLPDKITDSIKLFDIDEIRYLAGDKPLKANTRTKVSKPITSSIID